MAKLELLIIHNTATPKGREVSKQEIIDWHTKPKPHGNGWSKAGYTDMIHLDGRLENITPFDQDDDVEGFEITNGVRGINSISRHIVCVGGSSEVLTPEEVLTVGQLISLELYVKYTIMRHPNIQIGGHNQFTDQKSCPGFDVPDWCTKIGVSQANIYCP